MKNSSHEYKGIATSKGARAQTKIAKGVRPVSLRRLVALLRSTESNRDQENTQGVSSADVHHMSD